MPIQTRCPSCAAAVPSSAAWCSLCHADLRPPAPAANADHDGVGPSDVDLSDAPVDPALEPVDELLEHVPAGRHAARSTEVVDRPRPSGGRHAAGRARPATRTSSLKVALVAKSATNSALTVPRPSSRAATPITAEAVLEGIELPASGEVTPEQVDALAEQMLTRLAVTEARPAVLDPDDLPGGKWLFALGVMAAVVIVLLAVGTVVGLVVGR